MALSDAEQQELHDLEEIANNLKGNSAGVLFRSQPENKWLVDRITYLHVKRLDIKGGYTMEDWG